MAARLVPTCVIRVYLDPVVRVDTARLDAPVVAVLALALGVTARASLALVCSDPAVPHQEVTVMLHTKEPGRRTQ